MSEKKLGKNKPTPKQKKPNKAVTAPPPVTWREARKRKRELDKSLTKAEKKEQREVAKTERNKQYQLLRKGDPRALPARDQGPEKKLARDFVDSRRSLANLFLPLALVMLLITLFNTNSTTTAQLISSILFITILVWILCTFIETILNTRTLLKLIHKRYPNSQIKPLTLGFYLVSRALRLRKMRLPLPQVKVGDKI